MKKITIFLALAFMIAIVSPCVMSRDIKVMTYNVHNGVGLDKKRDHQRIARIINSETPDFVAIQEVDSATNRSGKAYVLGDIAEASDMIPIFAPAIGYDGGLYGIGLLSRTVPDSVSRIPLPGLEESRMLLAAHYKDCVVICTHLSLTPDDALASTDIIRTLLKEIGHKPVILMGDLNSLPDSPVIQELKQDFIIVSPADTPTFPANSPTERIDYVMISKNKPFELTGTAVLDEDTASDHRPISVHLRISD